MPGAGREARLLQTRADSGNARFGRVIAAGKKRRNGVWTRPKRLD